MYEAKRAGRRSHPFFGGSRRSPAGPPAGAGPRAARCRDCAASWALVFQPVFELETGEIVGVEALLRWNSPRSATVLAGEFIPVAEDTGSIVADRGVGAARELRDDRAASPRARASDRARVNVSARSSSPTPALRCRSSRPSPTPSSRPTARLEITETALIRADAVTARTLRELEAHGIRIVLDDFGTGFSSLSWLKEHPLDAIKIDRSFVSGLADDSARSGDRRLADRHGAGARLHRHRRGRRDRGAARRAARARAASACRASCWPVRCRRTSSRRCCSIRPSSLLSGQQPPLTRLTSVR